MHFKKMIAPIIITCCFILYYSGIALLLFFVCTSIWSKLLVFLAGVALSCVMLAMLIERIKEIRSGEEDDLSKY